MSVGAKDSVSAAVLKIRDAFEQFESQSSVLTTSYESLQKHLARSDRQLKEKNKALSQKVAELHQMSSRLTCVLDSLADGVLVVDRNLVIERSNPVAESLLGYDRHAVDGRLYCEITNGLGNAEKLEMAIREGVAFLDDERTTTTKTGRIVIVMASVAPIRSIDGSIVGAVEVLQDVTEMRLLQETANRQQRLVALGEMAASVAHEIRNPLGAIEGFARLLKRDLSDQPDHLRLASKIVEGAQNLNYVITNLLTYTRPLSVEMEKFDVTASIRHAHELTVARALSTGVTVSLDIPNEEVIIRGDDRQLRQVLLNLSLNALEACSEGGNVKVSSVVKDGSLVIEVWDDGCGIPEDQKAKVFDPFFTRKHGGTGLGLSLCHKIVSAWGGEISVTSKVDMGSTFMVMLPIGEKL